MLAALEGSTAIGRALVSRGAHIDASNDFGETALSLAAQKGYTTFTRWLLESGASKLCRPHGWNLNDWIKLSSGFPAQKWPLCWRYCSPSALLRQIEELHERRISGFIVAARSEDETEIRSGQSAGRASAEGHSASDPPAGFLLLVVPAPASRAADRDLARARGQRVWVTVARKSVSCDRHQVDLDDKVRGREPDDTDQRARRRIIR